MSGPTITVITPSYNQAEYLEATLRSILDQQYPHLEYLVIDGGSTDGSVDIIRAYADRLAYWVSEKDRGQGHAINKGFARATGELVTWLNSDDLHFPNTLRDMAEAYRDRPDDVIYGDYELITEDGVPFLQRKEIPFDWEILLYGVNFIGQPSSCFRRDVLDRFGMLDESLAVAMDYEYWLRLAAGGARFRHIPKMLSRYRYHPASKTVSAGGDKSAYTDEFEAVRNRFRSKPGRWVRRYKNMHARIRRQFIKLRYRGTIDWFGGPLSRLLYHVKRRRAPRHD